MTTTSDTNSKWETYAMYLLMALLSVAMFIFGFMKLIGNEMFWQQFINFGYSKWFFYLTGIIEVASAILIWPSKTRLVGAGLIVATMLGAAYSNLTAGDDDAFSFILTNILLGLLAVMFGWMNRHTWPLKR
jgi:putative oxidoreductase